MEIEKKFLLNQIPFSLEDYTSTQITQTYISTNPTIRLRNSDGKFFLTVKGSGSMAREEFELSLTADQYESLLKKAETPPLSKTRYFIPLPHHLTAELDIYYGNLTGLLTVEVEFSSLEQAHKFSPPSWFGMEITEDHRYKNTNLSQYGIPTKK